MFNRKLGFDRNCNVNVISLNHGQQIN